MVVRHDHQTKTKTMLNIVEGIHFHCFRNLTETNCAKVTGNVFSCEIIYSTAHKVFNLVDIKVLDGIMRTDITVVFNVVVTYENGDTSWVKHTCNLNKMTAGVSATRSNHEYSIHLPHKGGVFGKPTSYVGSIVLIGPPTLESLSNSIETATGKLVEHRNVVTDDTIDMKNPNNHISDVTLVLDDGDKVPACKALLATVSPVFNSMFCGGYKEHDVDTVHIPDADRSSIAKLVDFSSSRGYDVAKEYEDTAFVALCHKYMITYVVDRWCRFMLTNISHYNVVEVFRVANFLDNTRLVNTCVRCIRNNSTRIDLNSFEKEELVKIFSTKT